MGDLDPKSHRDLPGVMHDPASGLFVCPLLKGITTPYNSLEPVVQEYILGALNQSCHKLLSKDGPWPKLGFWSREQACTRSHMQLSHELSGQKLPDAQTVLLPS